MRKKYLIILLALFMAAGAAIVLFSDDDSPQETTQADHNSLPPAAISETPEKKTVEKADLEALAEKLPALPPKALEDPKEGEDPSAPVEEFSSDQAEEPGLSQEEEMEIYVKAQVFREEALEIFPVYSVEIHRPESVDTGWVEENGIMIKKSYGPPPNEVWIRIRPENAREMKEIMAQTADLYREYVNGYGHDIRIVHWVGGQAFAAATYNSDGEPVVH